MKLFYIPGSSKSDMVIKPINATRRTIISYNFSHSESKLLKFIKLNSLILRERPNAILTDSCGLGGILAFYFNVLYSIPYFIRVHGDYWSENTKRSFLQKIIYVSHVLILKKAKGVLPVSNWLRDRLVSTMGIDDTKVIPVWNAVDTNYFKTQHKKEYPSIKILSALKFKYPMKVAGIASILPVLDRILSEYFFAEYVIAGEGQFFDYFRKLVGNMSSKKQVKLIGWVDNMPKLYESCDIFLHISFLDSFANVVLEAKSQMLPVIVNRSCGVSESIQNGVDGFVIENGKELYDVLKLLIEDRNLRLSIGKRAREDVLDRFTYETIGKKFKIVISEMLRSRCIKANMLRARVR